MIDKTKTVTLVTKDPKAGIFCSENKGQRLIPIPGYRMPKISREYENYLIKELEEAVSYRKANPLK